MGETVSLGPKPWVLVDGRLQEDTGGKGLLSALGAIKSEETWEAGLALLAPHEGGQEGPGPSQGPFLSGKVFSDPQRATLCVNGRCP